MTDYILDSNVFIQAKICTMASISAQPSGIG